MVIPLLTGAASTPWRPFHAGVSIHPRKRQRRAAPVAPRTTYCESVQIAMSPVLNMRSALMTASSSAELFVCLYSSGTKAAMLGTHLHGQTCILETVLHFILHSSYGVWSEQMLVQAPDPIWGVKGRSRKLLHWFCIQVQCMCQMKSMISHCGAVPVPGTGALHVAGIEYRNIKLLMQKAGAAGRTALEKLCAYMQQICAMHVWARGRRCRTKMCHACHEVQDVPPSPPCASTLKVRKTTVRWVPCLDKAGPIRGNLKERSEKRRSDGPACLDKAVLAQGGGGVCVSRM